MRNQKNPFFTNVLSTSSHQEPVKPSMPLGNRVHKHSFNTIDAHQLGFVPQSTYLFTSSPLSSSFFNQELIFPKLLYAKVIIRSKCHKKYVANKNGKVSSERGGE